MPYDPTATTSANMAANGFTHAASGFYGRRSVRDR